MNRFYKATLIALAALTILSPSALAGKTWQQLNDEGETKYEQGDLKAAEDSFRQALQQAEKFPADDLRLARTLNNMGVILDRADKFAESEPMLVKALKIRRAKLPKNDPAIADTLNNLANLYKAQKKYAQAEPLYKQALEIYATMPKGGSQYMSMGLNNMAMMHKSQGKLDLAASEMKKALEYGDKSMGPESDHVIDMVSQLGELYDKQKKTEEAKPYYKRYLRSVYRAIEITEKDPEAHAKAKKFAAALRASGQAGNAATVDKAIEYESK